MSEGEQGEDLPAAVLFVCTHNAIRSPMAEALMRLRFGRLVRVESAGVRAQEATSPLAAAVLDEAGADIAGRRPKTLEALIEAGETFDLAVTLSPEAHHRALDLGPALAKAVEYWPTFDPSLAEGSREQVLGEFRQVRDGLQARIARRFARPSTG